MYHSHLLMIAVAAVSYLMGRLHQSRRATTLRLLPSSEV